MASHRPPPTPKTQRNAQQAKHKEKRAAVIAERRLPNTLSSPTGIWHAMTFLPYLGSCDPRDQDMDLMVGADIKLQYTPGQRWPPAQDNPLRPTRCIRIIQFKHPIVKDQSSGTKLMTAEGWAVDRGAQEPVPYFGLDAASNPKRVLNTPRGIDKQLVWKAMAQSGRLTEDKARPAWIIDTPREFVKVRDMDEFNANGVRTLKKEALFTTYAYDVDNAIWLGSVSWGYTVSIRRINDNELGRPEVTLRSLAVRSGSVLKQEEAIARNLWIQSIPNVPGRTWV